MMKKLALLLSACLLLAAAAYAAGGADSLISLSYLTGTFLENVEDRVDRKLDQSDEAILEQAAGGELDLSSAAVWQETRLKRGDLLTGSTGTNVLLLAGSGRVTYGSGAVVDVTTGTQIPSGTALAAVCTVLPFLLYTKGLEKTDAGKASVLATAEPFVAAITGAVFFHEEFTPLKMAGMILIFAAIIILNTGSNEKIY